MTRRRFALFCLAFLLTLTVHGQRKELHILAVNDIHAAIEAFPKLAAITDSLRALYPSLLVFSAGDNRTGNPISDMYEINTYPMVALMNQVGFDATTLGNHDFDVRSLPPLMAYSNFSYICANVFPADTAGLHIVPTKVFDVDGLKVGVIGVVEINPQGRPETHPDNVRDIRFSLPKKTVAKYERFSRHCDATILLSHLGYTNDLEVAENNPWIDVIIGGHTHTQLTDQEPLHNGVLITQNSNKLPMATHITLAVKDGRVVGKKAEYINVKTRSSKNRLVEAMVQFFSKNPYFERIVAQAAEPFKKKDDLNFLMCDAFLEEAGGEVSIVNNGGVRLDSLSAGTITMKEVLSMDPFYNETIVMELTGEDILKLLTVYSRGSLYHLPRVGGLLCEAIVDKADEHKDRLKRIRLKTVDGQDIDLEKTYKVITNGYMASMSQSIIDKAYHSINIQTAKLLTHYLQKQGTVRPHSSERLIVIEE